MQGIWNELDKLLMYTRYCIGNDMQTIVCRDFWSWTALAAAGCGLLVVVFVARKYLRERHDRSYAGAVDNDRASMNREPAERPAAPVEMAAADERSHEEIAANIRDALKTRAATPAPAAPRARGNKAGENIDTSPHRELMAIMLTDMVGYSGSMERDEKATYVQLVEHNNIIRTSIAHHRGREIKTIGDAFLVLFRSAIDAVDCALSIQRAFKDRNLNKEEGDKILIRIGVHLGDVLVTSNDVYGDGVNVASRIEPLAEPGGICVSGEAFAIVRKKLEFEVEQLTGVNLKNITSAPDVYRIHMP